MAYLLIILLLGGIGGALTDRLILPYLSTLPFFKNLEFLNPRSPIVITKREEIRINEGINYTETALSLKNVLASIYLHEGDFGSLRFRMRDHFSGILITSDGILAAPLFEQRSGQNITVLLAGQFPMRAELVAADQFTGVSFLKIAAKDLPVTKQVLGRDVKAGERLLFLWTEELAQNPRIKPVVLSADPFADASVTAVYSFDKLNTFLRLDTSELDPGMRGGVIVNREAALAGFVAGREGELFILRSDDFKKITDNFLDDEKISWPRFPIAYRILDSTLAELFGLPKKYGILVSTASSPLLINDFVYAVDGKELSSEEGFQDIVLSKKPGDKIRLKLIRAGKDVEIMYSL